MNKRKKCKFVKQAITKQEITDIKPVIQYLDDLSYVPISGHPIVNTEPAITTNTHYRFHAVFGNITRRNSKKR